MNVAQEIFARLNKFPEDINKEKEILGIIKGTCQYFVDEKIELTPTMIIELIENIRWYRA